LDPSSDSRISPVDATIHVESCLSLTHLVFEEKDLVSLLPLLPFLQTLHICERPLKDDDYPVAREAFFRALTASESRINSSENADSTTLHAAPVVIISQLGELKLEIRSRFSFTFKDLLVDMARSRPRLKLVKVKSDAYYATKEHDVQGMVEDLKLHLSCRPDFRIQGKEWAEWGRHGFQLELRSIHQS
jgi:hypothetical protein